MQKLLILSGFVLGALAADAQISNFDSLNGYTSGIENRLTLVRDRGLEPIRSVSESEFYFNLGYMDQKVDPVDERIRRDMSSSQAMIGYQWSQGTWAFGLNLNYDRTNTDYTELDSPSPTPTSGRVKGTGYQLALHTQSSVGVFHFGLEAGLGKADYDATRRSDAGSSTADFDSDGSFATLRLEYHLGFENGWTMIPFAAFTTARMKADGFAEAGGSPDRRVIQDFSIREHLGLFGVSFRADWGNVRPLFSVAWIERLSSDDFELTSTAPGGSNLASGTVQFPYSGLLAIQVAFDFDLSQNWQLTPEIRFLSGGDETSWRTGLGLRYHF
ncbi:MAG: autotransporter outer membrane beta-barrel domain-containing protein [Opitutales bacterium]|nr:autotransporter outer membrane beta-barrel domain-containing protein [Opitutales bacterium]